MKTMKPGITYDLHASLGYHLSLAARLQERRLEEGLRALGLSRISWCALLALGPGNLRNPSQIADYIGIDRTATSRVLRQMEATGLIARRAGTGDRRTTTVELTEHGHDTLARGVPLAEANNAALAGKLSAADHAQLADLLRRLTEGESRDLARF